MNKIIILTILILTGLTVSAKLNSSIQDYFSKYHLDSPDGRNKSNFLQPFIGDTILFNFQDPYLTCFSTNKPDTIWLKKRPKKDSIEGKHYVLNHAYQGIQMGNKFVTPNSAINDKSFVVSAITSNGKDNGCRWELVDLNKHEKVILSMPSNFPYDGTFASKRVNHLIDSLEGTFVYYSPDVPQFYTSKSLPPFTRYKVLDGSFSVKISKSPGLYRDFKLDTKCELVLQDNEGNSLIISPLKEPNYTSKNPTILTQVEYDQFKGVSVDSEVDLSILDEENTFPFSFGHILGSTQRGVKLYQHVAPTTSPVKADAFLKEKEAILIGDRLTVGEYDYFKACLNGKAFFVETNDVILSKEEAVKIDTLTSQPQDIREKFFKYQLALSKEINHLTIKDALHQLQSYSKYGLAIIKWGVYDMSEYTDGTGVTFTFYNPTQKDIKYVTITFQGYNAVDDPAGKAITKRCIGPIAPDESATYDFEYTWFTDIIEYAKIRSIEVQYRDGTIKRITNPNTIMFTDNLIDMFYTSNPVENLK